MQTRRTGERMGTQPHGRVRRTAHVVARAITRPGLLAVGLAFSLLVVAPAGAAFAASEGLKPGGARCAVPDHPGGAWPSLNHDLANTRFQGEERTIGVEDAPSLAPAWRFQVPAETGSDGGIQSTPIVANGCVYFTTAESVACLTCLGPLSETTEFRGSFVFALNADTGEPVWQTKINGFALGLTEANGLIYVLPSGSKEPGAPSGVPEPKGSHAVALDPDTGETVWVSERLDDDDPKNGLAINASPQSYAKGLVAADYSR